MKRISLMLALFLTLSFGMAFAQNPDGSYINLSSVDGLVLGGMPYNSGGTVTFHFEYYNGNANKVKGMFNSFELSATGGATWVGTYDNEFTFDPYVDFDLVWGQSDFSWDGALADSCVLGGSVITGPGLAPGYLGPGVIITVVIDNNAAFLGETFCIDSCYTPPSATWMWAYGSTVGSFPPDWDGPHCYDITYLDNMCPEFGTAPTTAGGDHCDLLVVDLTASDNEVDFINWTNEGTIGNVVGSNLTGQFTYQPVLADVGASLTATVGIGDAANGDGCETHDITLNFTNEAPVFTAGDGEEIDIGMGNTGCIGFAYDDVDCDPSSVSILSVTPAPFNGPGAVSIVGDEVCFVTASGAYPGLGDGGQLFTVVIEVTDGGPDKASSTATMAFNVLTTEPYAVGIEKTHGTLQGMHVIVDVSITAGSENMGGYDILIAYDASALNFQAAIPGDLHNICGWEYFNYRYGPFGNCGNQCPSGLLRVVAIAETNNGANHPTCLKLTPPFVLFSLDFLVSNDRTLECQYVPIRFFWMDCGDNSIAYHPVDNPTASVQGVSRYVIDFDLIGHIEDMFTGFPTYTGVQWECFDNDPNKPVPIQFVDFLNGGVDIICADSIDDRGDINLNGTANEIADAVLFSNYFVQGIGVFNVNYQGQVAASDVNADGLTLSVADLVYLIRVIVGDALPYPKLAAEAHAYAFENGVMSVDTKMGAAFVVIEGDVAPRLLAENMEMNYAFDGRNTRALVYQIDAEGFQGEFLAFDAPIVSVEMATYDGAPVAAKNVPTSYKLHQNYPNPFNSRTTIAFALPNGGDYNLTIYNVTGQKVASYAGSSEAGMVSFDWDAADQASGVYFYKLDTDDFTSTKKMVYLK